MHILIGLLTSLVTIGYLLHRLDEMGINLFGLNPFAYYRRRKWKKKHDADPIFAIESPMECTALILTAIAKIDGDMVAEEKAALLQIFQDEFQLSEHDSVALLSSSAHLYARGDAVKTKLSAILKPAQSKFSSDQCDSAIHCAEKIASIDGPASTEQEKIIAQLKVALLGTQKQLEKKWK